MTTDSFDATLFWFDCLSCRNVTSYVRRCNILFRLPTLFATESFLANFILKSKLSKLTRQNDCKLISEMAERRRAHRLPCFLT